jgi:hypothetical protein
MKKLEREIRDRSYFLSGISSCDGDQYINPSHRSTALSTGWHGDLVICDDVASEEGTEVVQYFVEKM